MIYRKEDGRREIKIKMKMKIKVKLMRYSVLIELKVDTVIKIFFVRNYILVDFRSNIESWLNKS